MGLVIIAGIAGIVAETSRYSSAFVLLWGLWGGRLKLLPDKLFYVNLALFKEFIVVLPLANSKISTCIQG